MAVLFISFPHWYLYKKQFSLHKILECNLVVYIITSAVFYHISKWSEALFWC